MPNSKYYIIVALLSAVIFSSVMFYILQIINTNNVLIAGIRESQANSAVIRTQQFEELKLLCR